jgi:hypothetical protein
LKYPIRANDGTSFADIATLLVPEGSIRGGVIDLSVSSSSTAEATPVTESLDNAEFGHYVALDNSTESTLAISGIAGGALGGIKWLFNRGNATIELLADSEDSLEVNRFVNAGSLAPFEKVLVYYNGTGWEIFS